MLEQTEQILEKMNGNLNLTLRILLYKKYGLLEI